VKSPVYAVQQSYSFDSYCNAINSLVSWFPDAKRPAVGEYIVMIDPMDWCIFAYRSHIVDMMFTAALFKTKPGD
jgi:hypothetical protein